MTSNQLKAENTEEENTMEEERERASELFELLNKEPKMVLAPFLRFTEQGVYPDVKLVKAKEEKDDKGDETEGGESEEGGKEE